MASNEYRESELDGLANTPTATDLGYEDSDLDAVFNTQHGSVELTPQNPADATEAWLRTTTASFVFHIDEWL